MPEVRFPVWLNQSLNLTCLNKHMSTSSNLFPLPDPTSNNICEILTDELLNTGKNTEVVEINNPDFWLFCSTTTLSKTEQLLLPSW